MSDADTDALEEKIRTAKAKGDHRALQRLYVEREAAQLRQFKASLARRARLNRSAP